MRQITDVASTDANLEWRDVPRVPLQHWGPRWLQSSNSNCNDDGDRLESLAKLPKVVFGIFACHRNEIPFNEHDGHVSFTTTPSIIRNERLSVSVGGESVINFSANLLVASQCEGTVLVAVPEVTCSVAGYGEGENALQMAIDSWTEAFKSHFVEHLGSLLISNNWRQDLEFESWVASLGLPSPYLNLRNASLFISPDSMVITHQAVEIIGVSNDVIEIGIEGGPNVVINRLGVQGVARFDSFDRKTRLHVSSICDKKNGNLLYVLDVREIKGSRIVDQTCLTVFGDIPLKAPCIVSQATSGEYLVTIGDIHKSIFGLGSTIEEGLANWCDNFIHVFDGQVEKMARLDNWVDPEWTTISRQLQIEELAPLRREFFGQRLPNGDGRILVHWLTADTDSTEDLTDIRGAEKIPVEGWFATTVLQRTDTHQIVLILDCWPGDAPEGLTSAKRQRLKQVRRIGK